MIAAITGSGRRGSNSSALALAALKAAGGDIHIDLAKLSFLGCTGCSGCRSGAPGCVLRDDLTPVLEKVASARGIILAAPVYYGYVSGIFKSFLDRWYGFRDAEKKLRIQAGRPLLMILSQGHPDPNAYAEMSGGLSKVYSAYGFSPHITVAAGLEGPGSVSSRQDLLSEAIRCGEALSRKASA